MPVFSPKPVILAGLGLVMLGTPACTQLRSHQGYVIDVDLVNSIQPGVDTRQSVQATLGTPTLTGQFGGGDWIYLSRDSRNLAYKNPKPQNQTTLRISFDEKGVVKSIDKTGVEQVASISPSDKTTPTLGRKRTLLQDLFGNIGTVGAAGAGPSNDNTGGP